MKSPRLIPRSQSLRQFTALEHRSRETMVEKDVALEQEGSKSHQSRSFQRRYTQSRSKNSKQISDKMSKNKQEAFDRGMMEEKSIENKEKESIKDMINNENHEKMRLFDEQRGSLIQLFEQLLNRITFPSTETIKEMAIEILQSQQQIFTRELKHSLTQTVQHELEKIRPNTNDQIVTETTEKCLSSLTKDNNSTFNRLFTEQKHALIEALTQQPVISSIDLIKRALLDALNESNPPSVITNTTTTNLTKPRPLSTEIIIIADKKQTRIDASFRQQRDTIVANRYLRDGIRNWSHIRSISSLIKKIQEYCTNDMESAWLLYYWIGRNIRYDRHCDNHTFQSIFDNRIGSSQGFAHFYSECCSLLNIPCFQIEGYTRQKDMFEDCLHVWNGILLDQYTHLIDSAWGADGDHSHEFEDFYFLTSPEEFVYTHFSQDYQLLQPTISKAEFLHLPLMKSNYYRLNLNLLSPKQAFNQIHGNLFKISLRTPAYVDIAGSLQVNRIEYPSHLHTLCQRDPFQTDIINCYFAPVSNGPHEIIIYAKTHNEMKYQETIYMRLNVNNLFQTISFPLRSQLFLKFQCILIEPFRRLVEENERICLSLKIPDAQMIKIINGDQWLVPTSDEYQNNILKKEFFVRGDIRICARWNEKTKKLSTICLFHMI